MQNSEEKNINLASSYTPYTLLRIYMDKYESIPDKVLYLDADTIILKDIKELYSKDISTYELAGVKDYLGKVFINPKYLNAGMLLLNIKKIKRSGLFAKCRHLLAIKKYPFPDQDALNKMALDKLYLEAKYNEQHKLKKDTVIRHYSKTIRWFPFFHTVNVKPWNKEELHSKYKVYSHDSLLREFEKIKIKEIN